MKADAAIEYMPATSLKRLLSRLDESGGAASKSPIPMVTSTSIRQSMPWRGVMAASVAVMAVALSLLATDRWLQFRKGASAPDYYTVTTARPRARGEVIRAVFAPTVTLVELQRILDESQLRIVAGPTEAGVYSLATNSTRPVNASLALLRAHSEVRFAEGTQPSSEPVHSP
jgi:hypothetical protein